MWEDEGSKRKSARIAALEAAKRSKITENTNTGCETGVVPELPPPATVDAAVGGGGSDVKRCRKRKRLVDPTLFPVEVQNMSDCSNKVINIIKTNPKNGEDGLKRGPGRPPKSTSTEVATTRRKRSVKYTNSTSRLGKGVRCDVNQRRESYYNFFDKNEPIKFLTGPKQLHLVNGGISYQESLMKFCKDLGPTAKRVARRMVSERVKNHQPQPSPPPLLPLFQPQPPPQPPRESWIWPQPPPSFLHLNPETESKTQNFLPNFSQPFISFGDGGSVGSYTDVNAADYKGKKVMVDDGKHKVKKLSLDHNFDFLFSNPKGGVKIREENEAHIKANDPSGDCDFLRCNYGVGQMNNNFSQSQTTIDAGGNQKIINGIGSFFSGNLKQNVVDQSQTKDYGKVKSCVYPTTYLRPQRKTSNSLLSLGGGDPPEFRAPPPQKSVLPPEFQIQDAFFTEEPEVIGPMTKLMSVATNPNGYGPNRAFKPTMQQQQQLHLPPPPPPLIPVGLGATGEEELQLALASYIQMPNHEPNLSTWPPEKPNQFFPYAAFEQQPELPTGEDFLAPVMPMPAPLQPPITMFGLLPELWDHHKESPAFIQQPDLGLQLGNSGLPPLPPAM